MITTTLKLNTLNDLREVLLDFSSIEEQQKYKDSVPYVHIPIEIIEQLSDQERMLRECLWYRELFTQEGATKIINFYKFCSKKTKKFSENFPDVPEIFTDKDWQEIMSKASSLYAELEPKLETIVKTIT